MSGMSLEPLQKAVYAALTGDAALMAIITGVFDRAPEGTAFPYLVFGQIEAESGDTLSTKRERVRLVIESYSRSGGRKQTDDILERVHTTLHRASFSLMSGFELMSLAVESSRAELMSDGLTWHGRSDLATWVAQT